MYQKKKVKGLAKINENIELKYDELEEEPKKQCNEVKRDASKCGYMGLENNMRIV